MPSAPVRSRPVAAESVRAGARRIAGLDGLRALAVAAVIAYHLDAPWAPGGFLGVDLFMVLSGYLITRLLLQEIDRTGGVDVVDFWVRRAKRLLPAALVFLVVTTACAALLFGADQLDTVRKDALAATFYVANWRFILADTSYFALFAETSPFLHLWSLAIEEQFYVLWPVVVVVLHRRRRALPLATLALAVASVAGMWLVADPTDPSRAYYGTDTRAHTLLAGCLLAMALHHAPASATRALARAAGPVVAIGTPAVLAAFVFVHDTDLALYRGGFALFAVLGAAVVGATALAGEHWSVRALDHPAMTTVGKASYSLYLWHWPVIVFATPERLGLGLPATNVLRTALTVVAAVASYVLVESPIRHRRLRPAAVGRGVLVSAAVTAGAIVGLTAGAEAPAEFFSATGTVQSTPATAAADRPSVLVLGDSVAASLSDALLEAAGAGGVPLATAPLSGCGLLPGVTLDGATQQPYEPSRHCAGAMQSVIDNAVAQLRPGVVVWLSVWDAENREVDGVRVALETADGRSALERLIDARVRSFAAAGIRTVLVTDAPVGRSGSLPAPAPDKQVRILAYNDVLRAYASAHPDLVGVIDLARHICPTDVPCNDRAPDGNVYRANDGVHYVGAPTRDVATWLVAQLRRTGVAG